MLHSHDCLNKQFDSMTHFAADFVISAQIMERPIEVDMGGGKVTGQRDLH